MAHWLVEDRIGERRAALVDGQTILEMAIEWDDDPGLRAGAILDARLIARADATGRGRVALDDGTVVLLSPVPPGLTEGMRLRVEIVREALPEAGATKLPRARPAAPDAPPREGPDLLTRIQNGGVPVCAPVRDFPLDGYGWTEALEEAETGLIVRPDVLLRLSPTPAMTLIDVDGSAAPAALAIAGAREAGRTLRRFGLTGSIGIDLPTLTGKAERIAAAEALDAVLPPPFERTGVNGFGFLQVVRRRERRSIVERLAADPGGSAARALLARGERAAGAGDLTLVAAPAVIARIAASPPWTEALARRVGAAVILRADPALAISAGHAARAIP